MKLSLKSQPESTSKKENENQNSIEFDFKFLNSLFPDYDDNSEGQHDYEDYLLTGFYDEYLEFWKQNTRKSSNDSIKYSESLIENSAFNPKLHLDLVVVLT